MSTADPLYPRHSYSGDDCTTCGKPADAGLHFGADEDLEIARLRAENAKLSAQKDGAYAERNQCVALIAKMALDLGWRVGVGLHSVLDVDWKDDWRTLLFIEMPTGQVTWHFHGSERHLLEGLPKCAAKWDGHDTAEKYCRVNAFRSTT